MLTLPDFKEKKIIFISNKGDLENNLKFSNSNIKLYKGNEFTNQVSCHLALSVFIIGGFTITSYLIKRAKEYGISIFMLNDSFETYAEIMSQAEGNYKLRRVQYTMGKQQELEIAKFLLTNKINNQQRVLKACKKSELNSTPFINIEKAKENDKLLGIEGSFAKGYFKSLFADIGWYRRAPRTKEDFPNLLLDIGYTFLFNYIDSLLRLFGFDPYKGFYHKLFFQRKSLSCDLMEPLRPLVDRQLVKSYNLGQINEKDFKFKNGSFTIKNGKHRRYVDIWFQTIVHNREQIYTFILNFYRYLLNPDQYKLLPFIIK